MSSRTEMPPFNNPDSIRLTHEQLAEPVLRLMTLAKENLGKISEFQEALLPNDAFLETRHLGSDKVSFETPDSQFVVLREQFGGWIFTKNERLAVTKKSKKNTEDCGTAVLILHRDSHGKIKRGWANFTLNYRRINERRYDNTNTTLEKIEKFLRAL